MTDPDQRYDEESTAAAARQLITMAELLPLARPQAFLWRRAVPQPGTTFIVCEPGGAKTWLAVAAAIAAARGESWLGREFVGGADRTSGVLYFNLDSPTSEIARRFARMGAAPNDKIWVHTHPTNPRASTLDFVEQAGVICQLVYAKRPRLLVIDSFRDAHKLDENDSGAMGAVVRGFRSLHNYNTAILILHHTPKGGVGLRGSGAIEGGADGVIALSGDDDGERVATWTKHRGWPMAAAEKRVAFEVVDEALERTAIKVCGTPRQKCHSR